MCYSVSLSLSFFLQDDEVVLQSSATIHKEQQKLCLAAEGFGNRLCFLESISNSKVLMKFMYFVGGEVESWCLLLLCVSVAPNWFGTKCSWNVPFVGLDIGQSKMFGLLVFVSRFFDRMCLQTCPSVPSYWSSHCRYEPFRRCWPIRRRRLKRWVWWRFLITPQHTNQGIRINAKKRHFADEPPALFHFRPANTEQWKSFVFRDTRVLLLVLITINNINGLDFYCPFVAPRAQIEPIIHCSRSFMAIGAKQLLTPPPNVQLHSYAALAAKCLGQDTTETESQSGIFYMLGQYIVGFCVHKIISDCKCPSL